MNHQITNKHKNNCIYKINIISVGLTNDISNNKNLKRTLEHQMMDTSDDQMMGVICYDRSVLSEGHKNYFKELL